MLRTAATSASVSEVQRFKQESGENAMKFQRTLCVLLGAGAAVGVTLAVASSAMASNDPSCNALYSPGLTGVHGHPGTPSVVQNTCKNSDLTDTSGYFFHEEMVCKTSSGTFYTIRGNSAHYNNSSSGTSRASCNSDDKSTGRYYFATG